MPGRWQNLVVVCLAASRLVGCAADPPVKSASGGQPGAGDARQLLAEALDLMEARSLGRDRVEWDAIRVELSGTVSDDAEPHAAHDAIRAAVARLGDPHAAFVPASVDVDASGRGDPATPSQHDAAGGTEVASMPVEGNVVPLVPSGAMLAEGVAFVTVAMCSVSEVEGLRDYARRLRGEVLKLDSQQPRAWIVDLRFNGGGNVWPMLVGLQPLLGEGVMATSINDGVITARVGVDGPAAWLDRVGPDGTRREEQLRIEPVPGDRPANPAPVGVLIGPWTMSSGELIALAFRGRARLFGEPTAGLTTVTDFFRLSDGSLLILPIAHMADRAGWMPDGPIAPDVLVVGDAWPSEHDAQASAAREWVLRNAGSPGRE